MRIRGLGAHVPAAKPPELCGAAAPQACRQARGAPPELRMQTGSFFRIPPLLPRLASFGRLPQAAPKEADFYTPPGGIYGFSVPIVAFFGAIDCFSGIRCFFVRTALHYYWLTHIIGLYIGYSIVSTD